MNIWIFSPYEALPYEGAGRLRYASLSEALITQGHRVTWWSSDWSHAHKKRREARLQVSGVESGQLGVGSPEAWIDALNVELVPTPAYDRNISVGRVWNHWCYARGIERRAPEVIAQHGQPDVILFSVPPMEAGLAALKLGRKYGAKVVLDVMDAWPNTLLQLILQGSAVGSGASGVERCCSKMIGSAKTAIGQVVLWPYSRMMRRYCREADAICAQSQAFAQYARSFGAIVDIPVFHLCAQAQPEPSDSLQATDHSSLSAPEGRDKGPLQLVYLGAMGRIYDLSTLVDAVIRLSDSGCSLHLDMIGGGEQRTILESTVAASGKGSVIQFHGFLQGAALDARLAQADVGIIPMHPESGVAIPYKGPQYLSFGLYILSSLKGELMEKLEQSDCGAHYPAGDSPALAAQIQKLAQDPQILENGKSKALKLFVEQFDRQVVHAAMAEWVERLVDE